MGRPDPTLAWNSTKGFHCFFLNHAGPRNNIWSSTFDPGRNQNMKKMGSSYYDKPVDNKTVWDQTLDSQKQQNVPESPTVASNNNIGMDVSEIQRLAVKNSKNGVVDMDAFMKSLKSTH